MQKFKHFKKPDLIWHFVSSNAFALFKVLLCNSETTVLEKYSIGLFLRNYERISMYRYVFCDPMCIV